MTKTSELKINSPLPCLFLNLCYNATFSNLFITAPPLCGHACLFTWFAHHVFHHSPYISFYIHTYTALTLIVLSMSWLCTCPNSILRNQEPSSHTSLRASLTYVRTHVQTRIFSESSRQGQSATVYYYLVHQAKTKQKHTPSLSFSSNTHSSSIV